MEIKKEWITDELPEAAIEEISEFAKSIAKDDKDGWKVIKGGVKTTQLRKFYGEVKRVQAKGIFNEKMAFKMLKPKLAYAAGRHQRTKLPILQKELDKALSFVEIDKMNNEKDANKRFNNFVQFFEAIVAYHKYHGGSDK